MKQIEAVIKEFDEKFAFSLHEMVDGDYCPALGVKLPSMYYREKTSAVGGNEPNFTITSNKGECQCGGQEKIDDIKAFLKSKLQEAFEAGIKQEKINTGRIKKRQYENGFKAGQKSMEKEIVEKIKNSKTPEKLIKEQYECYDFDEAEVYALENEIIENIIKSLSLTKETK